MTIQGMRDWIKKHRNWIIALFVLLIIGLVGTYASSGFGGGKQNGGVTLEQQLEASNLAIEDARQNLAANPDSYNELYALANQLDQGASVMSQAGQDEEAKAAYLEAADLYHKGLEKAPEDLNDAGRARMLLLSASCYVLVEDFESADKDFKAAIEEAPKDPTANTTYINYLVNFDRLDEALLAAISYQSSLPQGDANLENATAYVEAIKAMIESKANPEEGEAQNNGEEPAGTDNQE